MSSKGGLETADLPDRDDQSGSSKLQPTAFGGRHESFMDHMQLIIQIIWIYPRNGRASEFARILTKSCRRNVLGAQTRDQIRITLRSPEEQHVQA